MSTLQQLREGMAQTWDAAAEGGSEGWHPLRSHASHALTRFNLPSRNSNLQTSNIKVVAE